VTCLGGFVYVPDTTYVLLSLRKYAGIAVGFVISASNLCFCIWLDYHFRSVLFQLLDYYIPFLRSSLLSSARAVYLLGSYTLYANGIAT